MNNNKIPVSFFRSNSNPKPDFGRGHSSFAQVSRKYISELLTLVRQYEYQIGVLENKNKECGTQATAHLVEKVAHLEEQLKSKDEQLHLQAAALDKLDEQLQFKDEQLKRKDEQLHQQAVVLDKTKPKGAAKGKRVGNGWILFMKQRSLEKDLGEEFDTLEAFLEYSKDNVFKVKKPKRRVSLPKKGKGVGLKEFLKEMSKEYNTFDEDKKAEYNDAAKKLALEGVNGSGELSLCSSVCAK